MGRSPVGEKPGNWQHPRDRSGLTDPPGSRDSHDAPGPWPRRVGGGKMANSCGLRGLGKPMSHLTESAGAGIWYRRGGATDLPARSVVKRGKPGRV
ncbi:hypothetical protein FTUN_0408 [Frigoriglobus tundricola]|uniref:Uncharacterized protein n=1 Tax=Frigoriglobus tundricola TaxID=2774151 RepID=A0A6M5YHU9_9BACT|nr:hypothetical protein FTUN_0408 [Frigoriglobus tundricola]